MPDTHYERGGDECVPEDLVWAAYRELQRTDRTFPVETLTLARDVLAVVLPLHEQLLRQQLAAATARAEKAERQRDVARARLAELGEPETQLRIISSSGLVYTPSKRDLEHRADWVPGVRLEERQVYPTSWRVAPDALQDGRSGPVERSETSGGAFHANTSSILPQGPSEPEPPRDTSAWCWAPSPHTLLHCGLLRDHKPPHRRGERTWIDDTTEDGQHD